MTTISGFWHAAARLSGRIDWSTLLEAQRSIEHASNERLYRAGISKRNIQQLRQAQAISFEGNAIFIDSSTYPPALRHLPYAPPILFYAGNRDLLNKPCISIVGARKCSQQGKQLTHTMATALAAAGLVVVSGMAYGIDDAAHRAAPGKTIAVLGLGIDQCLRSHQSKTMSALIERGGLVISEFSPYIPASRHTFPKRNRIIAGLSSATVIVEATQRSGSKITARHALEYGREVMAVPGHPFSSNARGTNELIRQGALLVRDAQDVLRGIGLTGAREAEGAECKASIPESRIAKAIASAAGAGLSFDELHALTGLPMPQLIIAVESLELTGWVQRLPGGRVCHRNQA